ncbi:MAG: CarD family transcriptional regulator [Lachnospiraceae bacterium]|jgi:CarD family transcriptional regulator|nr:CarD family transcriptional regulator [Lachnospiraceae bacterium]
MFEVGEYVVYGNKGVCQIKSVGPIDMPGVAKDKMYYTMSQVYLRGSTIFTPVDNEKKALRKVLTKSEAKKLIAGIKDIKPQWVKDDKERDRMFTDILRTADCKELCNMIISLYHRKEERIAGGKKATSTDERYFHAAEDILYGELGIVLGMDKEKVRDCIMESVS